MQRNQEMSVQLQYEKHGGRYHIKSLDIPGFRMAGTDWDALLADLDNVVKDLLFHNSNFVVESLRWVPGPDDVKKHLDKPQPEGTATYVASGKLAA